MIDKSSLSKTIDFVRFPLILSILFIHTGIENILDTHSLTLFSIVRTFITDEVACLGVPLFFFISGFLFFYNCEFCKPVYIKKLKSRFWTLLIPYIIWNAAYLLLKFASESSAVVSVESKMVRDYGVIDYLQAFWNMRENMPINCPLWFLRDLIVLTILSPIIYFLVKRLSVFLPALLLSLWIFEVPSLAPFTWQWSFFILGAYFSIKEKTFALDKLNPALIVSYFVIAIASVWCWFYMPNIRWSLHAVGCVVGLFAVFNVVYVLIDRGAVSVNRFLASSSFFLFCFHYLFEARLTNMLVAKVSPLTDISALLIYLIVPILTCAVSLSVYYILSRFFPRLCGLLVGSRKK